MNFPGITFVKQWLSLLHSTCLVTAYRARQVLGKDPLKTTRSKASCLHRRRKPLQFLPHRRLVDAVIFRRSRQISLTYETPLQYKISSSLRADYLRDKKGRLFILIFCLQQMYNI